MLGALSSVWGWKTVALADPCTVSGQTKVQRASLIRRSGLDEVRLSSTKLSLSF